jgi:hypothetical protein
VPNKKPIIIIAVLSVLALGLGYWVGLPKEGSDGSGGGNGDPKKPEFLKEGLVAYYPFNGNAKDESGNGNDGEVNGVTLTKDRHGNADQAYFFDGQNDVISLPDALQNDGKSFTIALWFRADSLGADRRLFNSGSTWSCSLYALNKLQVWWKGIGPSWKSVSNEVTPAKWHQFVFTVEDQEASSFFDSSLVLKLNTQGVVRLNKLQLGSRYFNGAQTFGSHFHGTIDDIRIYNRALSDAEVKELYEFEKAN